MAVAPIPPTRVTDGMYLAWLWRGAATCIAGMVHSLPRADARRASKLRIFVDP
jgi:hypothetical protein